MKLSRYVEHFRNVMASVMENMLVLMTVIKISMLRIKYRSLSQFLIETKTDYTADNYKNDKEKLIFF
ncbi:odorant receptor 13a-like [Vespula squamosa]|uniref:Odorant receptor 13a-like n=1 Tax=Vespula squamosa TaxID=30214 RepID=A0ABD2BHT6_VESSQ